MSEKALKVVPAPESKTSPGATNNAAAESGLLARLGRGRLRMILLFVLPAIAIAELKVLVPPPPPERPLERRRSDEPVTAGAEE